MSPVAFIIYLRTSEYLLKIPYISRALHAGNLAGNAQQLYFKWHKWYLPAPVWNCTDQTTGLGGLLLPPLQGSRGLEVPAFSSRLSPEDSWVIVQLRLVYSKQSSTSCSRELLARACLELTTGEIYLVFSRWEGHNSQRSERGLRNAGSELLEDLCRFSNPVGTLCWAQLLGEYCPRRFWEVLQSFPGKVQQSTTHLCLITWAIPSLCSCWSGNHPWKINQILLF